MLGSMSNLQESPPQAKRFLPGLLIVGFAICNFLMPLLLGLPFGPSPGALAPVFGIILASLTGQCCLLAVWGVLGPLGAPARLITTLAIAAFLMASFGVGITLLKPPDVTVDGEVTALFWSCLCIYWRSNLRFGD